jgi:5-methylcytosine-specific restriction endonuclease McrA
VYDAGISNARLGNDCAIAAGRPESMTSVNSKYPVYTCTKCGETKSTTRENFSTRNGKPRLPCRACKRKYVNEHAANNRGLARASARKRKALNENIGVNNEHIKYLKHLLKDQDSKCYFCDSHITIDTIEVDHLIPVSRDGTNDYVNLSGCCYFCNREKHDKTEEEYILWRKDTYKNFK